MGQGETWWNDRIVSFNPQVPGSSPGRPTSMFTRFGGLLARPIPSSIPSMELEPDTSAQINADYSAAMTEAVVVAERAAVAASGEVGDPTYMRVRDAAYTEARRELKRRYDELDGSDDG